MLRIVPHTVPRIGRSYEHFPDGFELHLLGARSYERGTPVGRARLGPKPRSFRSVRFFELPTQADTGTGSADKSCFLSEANEATGELQGSAARRPLHGRGWTPRINFPLGCSAAQSLLQDLYPVPRITRPLCSRHVKNRGISTQASRRKGTPLAPAECKTQHPKPETET